MRAQNAKRVERDYMGVTLKATSRTEFSNLLFRLKVIPLFSSNNWAMAFTLLLQDKLTPLGALPDT